LNALVIWIVLPGLAAILLYFLRRWEKAVHIAGLLIALMLAGMAWQLPIDKPLPLRLWPAMPNINISASLPIFGANFTLDNSLRPVLVMIYLSVCFWIGGAYSARAGRLFTPFGLGIAALLTSALAVTPVTYAAMLIELAILLCVPLFSPPGSPVTRGVRRFLTFQTIGMVLVLLADYFLAAAALQSSRPADLRPAMLIAGLGFALILPIFPFHSWMPMLAGETNPYSAAFIFFLLPAAVSFLLFNFLIRYTGTEIAPEMYAALRTIGALMVLSGGLWAVYENHLGRMLGFIAIQQIGSTLLALSLNEIASPSLPLMGLFFAQLLPRSLGLAVYAQSLSILQQYFPSLQIEDVAGAARRFPIVSAGLALGIFSLAGLPLLASFPVYYSLWAALAHSYSSLAFLAVIGSALIFIAGLRTIAALVRAPDGSPWHVSENGLQGSLIGIGLFALLAIGLAPQLFIPYLTNMAILLSSPFP
jgi:formate hydrogenlyase subunit 3/multisubunit Na+/H+ antiporter MnhD subunit